MESCRKNLNQDELPETIYHEGNEIDSQELEEKFADYFEDKITRLTSNAIINPNVYNGLNKIHVPNENFMTPEKVMQAMKELKIKNCEGADLIPQRILAEGIEVLHGPFCALFSLVYKNKQIPEQWKLSQIT